MKFTLQTVKMLRDLRDNNLKYALKLTARQIPQLHHKEKRDSVTLKWKHNPVKREIIIIVLD